MMSGPAIPSRRWLIPFSATRMDRAMAIGPADVRPCGCINDPGVFGHSCPAYQPIRRPDDRAR